MSQILKACEEHVLMVFLQKHVLNFNFPIKKLLKVGLSAINILTKNMLDIGVLIKIVLNI